MKKPFNKVIGIIGGGQLGKMLIESGLPMNIQYNVLDPDPDAPCRKYAKTFINADLNDRNAIKKLASISDVVTYEIEHINVDALIELEKEGKTVIPSASVLQIINDKSLQKKFYVNYNLPTSFFREINKNDKWKENLKDFNGEKVVVKLCKGGYDGRGVEICNKSDIESGKIPFDKPCIIEEYIQEITELSVLVASDGKNIVNWEIINMDFDPKLNLVDYLSSPANFSNEIKKSASDIACKAVKCLKSKGVFAIEMFLTKDNQILINEIAPRPHNSGHHTIEASFTSQYQQLNRILLDLPLGNTEKIKASAMVNIIGPKSFSGNYEIQGLDFALKQKGFYLHLYNKKQSREGRKLGHFTVLAETAEEAIKIALEIKEKLKIIEVKQ
ncbi:MAG: 5-(carboxyamino)imidazole ribonucleotide synthase [Bacteroidia bacterium]|nr:5-(carboxyamino)imidazole ribonucleotide synthase [Bacteroidia bacterium]